MSWQLNRLRLKHEPLTCAESQTELCIDVKEEGRVPVVRRQCQQIGWEGWKMYIPCCDHLEVLVRRPRGSVSTVNRMICKDLVLGKQTSSVQSDAMALLAAALLSEDELTLVVSVLLFAFRIPDC